MCGDYKMIHINPKEKFISDWRGDIKLIRTQINMHVEWINDIGYVHIVIQHNDHDEVSTYGNFLNLVCFTGVSF